MPKFIKKKTMFNMCAKLNFTKPVFQLNGFIVNNNWFV